MLYFLFKETFKPMRNLQKRGVYNTFTLTSSKGSLLSPTQIAEVQVCLSIAVIGKNIVCKNMSEYDKYHRIQ